MVVDAFIRTAAATAAATTIPAALFASAIGLADALVVHARILPTAFATTSTATVATTLLPIAVRLTNALVIHASILPRTPSTAAATAVIPTLLARTCWINGRIQGLAIKVISDPVVIVVIIETICITNAVCIWKTLVDLIVAVVI